MMNGIHILGASGSGTSTLARALEVKLGYCHFDTDDYFWLPSQPPYTQKRPIGQRIEMIDRDLDSTPKWSLSGSLCGWGDVLIPKFDLVVYLWIPSDIRLQRLIKREENRYGQEAVEEGGSRYEASKEFIEWASQYDTGGMDIRSKVLHKAWLEELKCPVLRLEGDLTVDERVKYIESFIHNSSN